MGVRFNRLHFFKRFDPTSEYILLRELTINGTKYSVGDSLDKTMLPMHKIKGLFNSRKIASANSVYQNDAVESLTKEQKSDNTELEIKSAGPAWMKVWRGETQIGKTVRTRQEAEAIVAQWHSENA